jgi:hypothetical protein
VDRKGCFPGRVVATGLQMVTWGGGVMGQFVIGQLVMAMAFCDGKQDVERWS